MTACATPRRLVYPWRRGFCRGAGTKREGEKYVARRLLEFPGDRRAGQGCKFAQRLVLIEPWKIDRHRGQPAVVPVETYRGLDAGRIGKIGLDRLGMLEA